MINLYTTSTIGNYKTGTVTCTKNSPTVTGTGTTWKEIVNPGDILTLDDDKFYIISAVNSNTSLTLDKNFAENTATNVSYRILLNTAAHFPSDTAAKVERALEQLSDINEAAINNNRTVTAATYIDGKGIQSYTGSIHLYPNSVSANQSGSVLFHYNQSSSPTTSIYENAPGTIRLNGDLSISGKVVSNIVAVGSGTIPIRIYDMNPTSTTAQRFIQAYDDSGSTGVGSLVFTSTPEAESHDVRLRANNAGTYADLGVVTLSDGTKYAYAPTYSANYNDNSSKIATTGFVRGALTYGYIGDVNLRTTSSADEAGTSVSRTLYFNNGDSNAGHRLAMLRAADLANGGHKLEICALHYINNAASFNTMTFETTADNVKSIRINTPATSDNSSQIATTAFVNNRLPYTAGSWTPVLAGGTTEGEFTHTAQFGRYTRIGNICIFYCRLSINGIVTEPSGAMFIKGLPYTSLNQVNCGAFIAVGQNSFRKIFGGSMLGSSTKINLWANNTETPSYKDSAVWGTSSDKTGYKIYETTASLWCAGFYYIAA